jgi:RNA polymerase primary sigma factor
MRDLPGKSLNGMRWACGLHHTGDVGMQTQSAPVEMVGVASPAIPAQRQSESPDSVRLYLREIGRIALLSAEDEVRLAREIEVGVLAAERLHCSQVLSRDEKDELAYLTRVGVEAKAMLVQSNLRLVVAVAKRYAGSGTPLLDLIQEGNIGLIRAVEKFDYRRGFKFSTYATWWIRQAISRGLADQSRTIRVPVHVVEAMRRALRIQRSMFQLLGRNPSMEELAGQLETSPEKAQDLLSLATEPISLDLPVGDGESGQLSDLIVDADEAMPVDEVGLMMLASEVEQLLDVVNPRERRVVRLRFGLDGGRTHTLEEVGAALGVTRERARQIESKALARIRTTQSLESFRDYLH